MTTIAIITARGGSKRIPKKNIRDFHGKPIIAYSIEAALESNIFDEVMVSTDSEKIADIAIRYGAKVPFFRSKDTSDDFATTAEVLQEVLEKYRKSNKEFDYMCCIYPTAPFITASKLQNAMKELINSGADSVIPVVRFSYPPQRAVVIKDGLLCYQYPEYEKTRSQDLEPIYHDCGQFYLCKTEEFKKYNSLFTPNSIPFVIAEEEVQDIDNDNDWKLAEIKYKLYNSHKNSFRKDR